MIPYRKNMKPENIKYYMPSAVLPKPDILQDPQSADAAGTVNPAGDVLEPGSAADVLKRSSAAVRWSEACRR